MVQHTQINMWDTPHSYSKNKNHMIISIDAKKKAEQIGKRLVSVCLSA